MSDTALQPTTPPTPQARFDMALDALKGMRRKYAIEYLVDLRQRDAAIRAGYSAKSADQQASALMKNPEVFEAIAAGLDLQAMSAGEILARLSAQARGDMADFVRVDEEEITLTWSLKEIPTAEDGDPDMAGAIYDLAKQKIVRPTEKVLYTATVKRAVARLDLLEAGRRGKLGLVKKYALDEDTGKISIELYDAQAALIALGKHRRLWGDDAAGIMKHIDLSKLAPEQLERLSAGEDPYAVLLG
jgi:phage terminase small subunit